MKFLVIDIDSLRADHVSCYGYGPETTPYIDDLASDGTIFSNAYAANSPSLPSRAALITGRYGINNGVETHGPDAYEINSPHTWDGYDNGRKAYWTLPELFYRNRVETVAIAPDGRHPSPWFFHTWHTVHQPQESSDRDSFMEVDGEKIADTAVEFLDGREDDFFLYTQFWDLHAPSKERDEGIEPEVPDIPSEDQIEIHREYDTLHSAEDLGIEGREDLRKLLSRYDNCLRYIDRQIGRIIRKLEEEDLLEETTIVVTADHGEEFGEHGVYREHWSTYEGTQRVPLIVSTSGENVGVSEELVSNVDLAPTLADLAGIEPPERWQGESLKPLLEGDAGDWRDSLVLDHGLYTAQRAVRKEEWKLIRTYHPGVWHEQLDRIELYDLSDDPCEQKDVSKDRPRKVSELIDEMKSFVDRYVGRDGDELKNVAEKGPVGSTGAVNDLGYWK